jgi:hypothetical protein
MLAIRTIPSVVFQKYVEEIFSITGRARVSEELYSGNLVLLMNHQQSFEIPLCLQERARLSSPFRKNRICKEMEISWPDLQHATFWIYF